MQSYAHHKGNYVYVRRKRTRSIDVRREDDLYSRRSSSLSPHELVLHYVGSDRECVCRCSDPERHREQTFTVASESRHLSAGLMLFLDRHGLQTCAITDFRKYRKAQEADWAMEDVYVEDFHYTSRDKNVVCRCSQSRKHSYSAPRNPGIVEQCAEFFSLHKDRDSVTKDQWKGVNGDSPPAYSSSVGDEPKHMSRSLLGSPRNIGENVKSRSSLETKMRDAAERIASVIPGRHRRASTPERQPDIPPQVWQRGRPSGLMSRPGTSSLDSTPMGSAPPSTRAVSPAASRIRKQRFDSVVGTSSIYSAAVALDTGRFRGRYPDSRKSAADVVDGIPLPYANKTDLSTKANESVACEKEVHRATNSVSSAPFGYDEWYQDQPPNLVFEDESEQLLPSTFYVDPDRSVPRGFQDHHVTVRTPFAELPARESSLPFGFDDHGRATRTAVAELPARRSPVELPDTQARQRHTATLKRLEGRTWDTISELEAKRFSIRCTEAPRSTSNTAREAARLSSRFEQNFDATPTSLPSQEQFLLRYAMPSSWRGPAPNENCYLCGKLYRNSKKQTVIVPECGCSMHETCLMNELRKLDEKVGRCPFCEMHLCKRSLTDRIGTDIELIFESQVTPLREEVSLEFPQRSQHVTCSTEEGVAVAQLRLIKDYVDVHAEEVFRLWEGNRAEPDWYGGVVRPVVQLFQGWNSSVRSRFFVNQDAFLKLVAWGELVRLMYTSYAATKRKEGVDAQFPRLEELYHKFTLALDRYDKEKVSWDTSRSGIFEHDTIAMDIVEIAVDTHLP
jgi:hypothetical protein